MKFKAMLLSAAFAGSGLFLLRGQQPTPESVFTAAQAEAGRKAYDNTCGQCHTPSLLGRKGESGELPALSSLSEDYRKFIGSRGFVPPLAGKSFIDRWGSKTSGELIARFQETVDFFKLEGKDKDFTVNLTAYVLLVNGAKAGSQPLTRNTEALVNSVVR